MWELRWSYVNQLLVVDWVLLLLLLFLFLLLLEEGERGEREFGGSCIFIQETFCRESRKKETKAEGSWSVGRRFESDPVIKKIF